MNVERIGVIGGGSWGTALVKILSESGKPINWWLRNEEDVQHIVGHSHNPKYLSSVTVDTDQVKPTSSIEEAIRASDLIFWVVPSAFLLDTLSNLPEFPIERYHVSAIKGVVPDHLKIVGDYFTEDLGLSRDRLGVVTGPCHAEEVAMERLSYLTAASENADLAETMGELLTCDYISTTLSDDIYGTEYAAVLKNVYAIAGGICHALGRGDNFQAVLMSNAIREIKRFIDAIHPINRDINNSAYLGDLLVTGYSQFSRNRTLGTMLGKGYSVKSAILEMNMIAEGYYAANSVFEMNRSFSVSMPILNFVHAVLHEGKKARMEIATLEKALD
jgi:glycerol-3-phosphate dehydrogenase (NAD(P)+)